MSLPHAAHSIVTAPSDWVQRWTPLIRSLALRPRVLDLACGTGRHLRWLQSQGCDCLGVDHNAEALAQAAAYGQVLQADLEQGPWPLRQQQFDAIVVTHYLWRPLWPHLKAALAPGGVLVYETFTHWHAQQGLRPSRPEFVLRDGELLELCHGLAVVAFEQGRLAQPTRYVQRIVAAQARAGSAAAWPLTAVAAEAAEAKESA